jgi:hypothetical protein
MNVQSYGGARKTPRRDEALVVATGAGAESQESRREAGVTEWQLRIYPTPGSGAICDLDGTEQDRRRSANASEGGAKAKGRYVRTGTN